MLIALYKMNIRQERTIIVSALDERDAAEKISWYIKGRSTQRNKLIPVGTPEPIPQLDLDSYVSQAGIFLD